MIFGKSFNPKIYKHTLDGSNENLDGIVLTSELIEAGMSDKGGYNSVQLKAPGIDWPPPKGWKKSVIGTIIHYKDYETFINHKNNKIE